MANTIDILLRTKADTSGIDSAKKAVKSLSGSLQGGSGFTSSVNSAGKGLQGFGGNCSAAGESLVALSASMGASGLAVKAFGIVLKYTGKSAQVLSIGSKALSGAIGALGKGVAGTVAGMGTFVASMGVAVVAAVKLTSATREARKAHRELQQTYQDGYRAGNTAEGHAAYQRTMEAYKKAAEDCERANKESAEKEKRRIAEANKADEEYMSNSLRMRKERLALALIETTDERKALQIKREIAEVEAEAAVERAKMNLDRAGDGQGERVNAAEAVRAAELTLQRVRKESEVEVKKFDDAKITNEKERVRLANEAAEAEQAALQAKREEEERIRRVAEAEALAERNRKETTAAVLAIEEKIARAKSEAARLEENAARARGKSFNEWQRGERERAREGRDDRSGAHARAVDMELAKIREINPRARSAYHRNRLAKLLEWKADQDPANNPAAKEAERLEAEKRRIMENQEKYLADIAVAVKNAGL